MLLQYWFMSKISLPSVVPVSCNRHALCPFAPCVKVLYLVVLLLNRFCLSFCILWVWAKSCHFNRKWDNDGWVYICIFSSAAAALWRSIISPTPNKTPTLIAQPLRGTYTSILREKPVSIITSQLANLYHGIG